MIVRSNNNQKKIKKSDKINPFNVPIEPKNETPAQKPKPTNIINNLNISVDKPVQKPLNINTALGNDKPLPKTKPMFDFNSKEEDPAKATLKDLTINSLKMGYVESLYGQESYKEMMGLPNKKKYYEEKLKGEDYSFIPDKWYQTVLSDAMKLLGQQFRQATDPRSLAMGTTAAGITAAAGNAGPQVLVPEEIITVPAAFTAGVVSGSSMANLEIEAGHAYNEMIENGVSPKTAKNIALFVGGANAMLEGLQIDDLIKSFKILNAKDVTNSAAKKIGKYLKNRGLNVLNETTQEVLQEGVTTAGANVGSKIDKGKWEYNAKDIGKRLGETAVSSALSFGLLGAGGDTINYGKNKIGKAINNKVNPKQEIDTIKQSTQNINIETITETPQPTKPTTNIVSDTSENTIHTVDNVSSEFADTPQLVKFAPENASGTIKTLEDNLIFSGANDVTRQNVINTAVNVESTLGNSEKSIDNVLNGNKKITQAVFKPIENIVDTNSKYWDIYEANLSGINSNEQQGEENLSRKYATLFSDSLREKNTEAYKILDSFDEKAEDIIYDYFTAKKIPENAKGNKKLAEVLDVLNTIKDTALKKTKNASKQIYGTDYIPYGQNVAEVKNEPIMNTTETASEAVAPVPDAPIEVAPEIVTDATTDITTETENEPLNNETDNDIMAVENGGKVVTAYTNDNQPVKLRYKLVNIDDLIVSNNLDGTINPAYPQELQPRDRTRYSSMQQINDIAKSIIPAKLGESVSVSEGAPVIGPDNVVESGNGRTMALTTMYQKYKGIANYYKEYLKEWAEKFGINPEDVTDNVILVRERISDTDRNEFVKKANESEIGSMSATEKAKMDAERIDSKLLELLVPNDNGDLNSPENREFVKAFINSVIPANERNNVLNANNNLSIAGLERITNAIFYKAYKDDKLSASLTESLDNDIKNITKALLNIAPTVVKISNDISEGNMYDMNFVPDIIDAIEIIQKAKSDNLTMDEYLAQVSFDNFSDEAKELASVISQKSRSVKQLTSFFNILLDEVIGLGNPQQFSFDEYNNDNMTKGEVITHAIERFQSETGNTLQSKVFASTDASQKNTSGNNESLQSGTKSTEESTVRSETEEPVREKETEVNSEKETDDIQLLKDKYVGKEFSDGEHTYRIIAEKLNIKGTPKDVFTFQEVKEDGTLKHFGARIIDINENDVQEHIEHLALLKSIYEKNLAFEAENQKKKQLEKEKVDAERKYLYQFTKNMTPMQKAKVEKTLLNPFNTEKYGFTSYMGFIQKVVNDKGKFVAIKELKQKYKSVSSVRNYVASIAQINKRLDFVKKLNNKDWDWIKKEHPFAYYLETKDESVLDDSFYKSEYRVYDSNNPNDSYYPINKTAYDYGKFLESIDFNEDMAETAKASKTDKSDDTTNSTNTIKEEAPSKDESIKNKPIKTNNSEVEKDVSQSGILAGESGNDDRGLHSETAKTNEKAPDKRNDTNGGETSEQLLQPTAISDGYKPDDRDDGERVYGTDDRGTVTSETETNDEISTTEKEPTKKNTPKNEVKEETTEDVSNEDEIADESEPEEIIVTEDNIKEKVKNTTSNKENYVITNTVAQELDDNPPNAEDNIRAIELLIEIEDEGRPATEEEKVILSKYKGWGGIDIRDLSYDQRMKLNDLFNSDQLAKMRSSSNNAFFTPTKVIDAMYKGLKRMGFKGGNVLEPSMGTGNFFGRMPKALSSKSSLTGVELESYTARIAQVLYPGAVVINKPFQDVAMKNNSFSLVVGNVPFGSNKLTYNKKKYSLHNYFILSSLDKVKEGGIVAVITSAGTLDSYSIDTRKAIMDKADVVACYKLPEKVFSKNADTNVATDLLIFRKRATGEKPSGDSILNVVEKDGLQVNEYFIKNPQNVLGTLTKGTNAWGEITTVKDDGDFYNKLDTAMSKLPKDLITGQTELKPIETIVSISSRPRFYEKDGQPYFDDGLGTATSVTNRPQLIKDYIKLRDTYKELLSAYENDLPDKDIAPLRTKLNKLYDNFYKKHTAITGDGKKKIGKKQTKNNEVLSKDSDYYLVSGLEYYNSDTKKFEKSALFEKDTLRKKKIDKVNSSSEALIVSLNEYGNINLNRMSELTGKTESELVDDLKGEIILTPDGDYELTDIYLSGNIYEKIDEIKDNPKFAEQKKMLEEVIPTPKEASEIDVKLGANYIDTKYIEDFSKEVFGTNIQVSKDDKGKWEIEGVRRSRHGALINNKYGTPEYNAIQLLEKILNDREIVVKVKYKDENGSIKESTDDSATDAAVNKANDIRDAFENWVFKDSDRRNDIVKNYNLMYNNYRNSDYEKISQQLTFDEMNPSVKKKLYPHQKTGVARFIFGGNILFAHGVGTGKTYEMIASVMEAKRMGIINKTAMVVPNTKITDFKNDIYKSYPSAKVLVIDTKKDKRKLLLGLVNSNDWDIVLIPRTTFTKIPVSPELRTNFYKGQLEEIDREIAEAEYDRNVSRTQLKQLYKQRDSIETELKDIDKKTKRDEESVDFEKLGFDCICVDEAHNYKGITTRTKLDIKGLASPEKAQMANDMLMKLDYMRTIGGKIIFGTGTPITNTVSEIYNMTRMLRPDILEDADIHSLDEWVNTFANIEHQTEINIGNNIKSKSTQVIRSFHNPTEMIGMYRQFADIVFTEDVVKTLPKADYKPITIEATPEHIELEKHINNAIEQSYGRDTRKNYARIMTMADMAAADLRMLSGADSEFNIFKDYSVEELENEDSKINVMCNYILDEYKKSNDIKGTQIIFCDRGAGSGDVYSFNLHKDIKNKLIKKGIPETEIVIIKDQKDSKLEELFEKVNKGEVRVLIGTSQKMAEGLNVQERAVAIHHPTVTFKPSDWEQSNARAIRSGNINKEVRIYRYTQEHTYDAYKWQALERKAEVIKNALRGDRITEMEDIGADDEGSDIDFASAMAIASGNPLVKEKIDIDKEVKKLNNIKKNYLNEVYRYQDAIAKNPNMISQAENYLTNLKGDIKTRDTYSNKHSMIIKGKTYDKQNLANTALVEAVKKAPKNGKFIKLGTYDDFDILFKGDTGGLGYVMELSGNNNYKIEYAAKGNNIARFAGALNRLTEEQKNVENRIELLRKDLEIAKEEVNKPFEKEQELNEALAKQKDITYRYEHYNDKNKAPAENDNQETKYSIDSKGESNERDNLLSGNRERNNESAGKQVERLSEKERKAYAKEVKTEKKVIANKLLINLVDPADYNDDIKSLISEFEGENVNIQIYVGRAKEKFDTTGKVNPNAFVVGGKDIYLKYDANESLKSLILHELVHIHYKDKEVQAIKNKILGSLTKSEIESILESPRYSEYMEIYDNNIERTLEEFIADTMAGMNEYTEDYADIVNNYWNKQENIDTYNPADYKETIDSGANKEFIDNIGFGNVPATTKELKYSTDSSDNSSVSSIDNDIEELTPERKQQIFDQYERDHAEMPKPTQKELWGERFDWIKNNATRTFANIPETGKEGRKYAEFRKMMVQWKSLPSVASFMAQDKLNQMTKGLTPKEYNTFAELVYFKDLQEEAELQKAKGYTEILLPNEITPDEVNQIIKEVEKEATPKVFETLNKRKKVWDELKKQYIRLNQLIGFDTDDKFKRDNYYHHQVIEYMANESKGTGNRNIGVKAGRGWLKERQGSTKAINTDFLNVEYKSLLQMQYDVYIAETLSKIKEQYDIKPILEKEALALNKQMIKNIIAEEAKGPDGAILLDAKGNPDSETYRQQQWFNQRIMIGFSGLMGLAENGYLPNLGKQYSNVINALANGNLNAPGIYNYISDLASMELSENASPELEQAVINAKTVLKYTAKKKAWVKKLLGDDYLTWEILAKETPGYSIHQPRRGNYFYTKEVIDEDVWNNAFNEMVIKLASGEKGVDTTESIQELFSQYADTVRLMGAAYEQWVIPDVIIDTMDKIANPKQKNPASKLLKDLLSAWKGWATGINPLRTFKFGIRNMFGDLDAVIAGKPQILKYTKQAVNDIYKAMHDKVYTPEFMEWVERGGFSSMIFANEMDKELQNKLFSHLLKQEKLKAIEIPATILDKYYDKVQAIHDFREAILRYSAYLYFKSTEADRTESKDYVASKPDIVIGLHSKEDKAYQLSKDLLGAYDEVSAMGQFLRSYLVPFYSFTETNIKRYYRLFKNILTSNSSIPKKAKDLLLKAFMVNLLTLLIAFWNRTAQKDNDDKLPPSTRDIPHITLGRIGNQIFAFRQLGSFNEILEWFGLDDLKWDKDDKTALIDKAWGMITPFIKVPVELGAGLNFYPSFTHPRAIRDKADHVFNTLGISDIYRELSGKPTKGVGNILKNAVTYSYDYQESAYYEILDKKREFQKREDNTIYGATEKSNALYYMKTAIRYKDKKAATKYMNKYFEAGGTIRGMKQSFDRLDPMYGFTSKQTMEKGVQFVKSLSPEDKERLKVAQNYYETVLRLPPRVEKLLSKKDITDKQAKNVLTNYINATCK